MASLRYSRTFFSGMPSNTGVATLMPSFLQAQPRCVSSTCPTFMREGTPSGFRQISIGRAVGEERHVFLGHDLGDHALVTVTAGHLVTDLELLLRGDVDLDLLDGAIGRAFAGLDRCRSCARGRSRARRTSSGYEPMISMILMRTGDGSIWTCLETAASLRRSVLVILRLAGMMISPVSPLMTSSGIFSPRRMLESASVRPSRSLSICVLYSSWICFTWRRRSDGESCLLLVSMRLTRPSRP